MEEGAKSKMRESGMKGRKGREKERNRGRKIETKRGTKGGEREREGKGERR